MSPRLDAALSLSVQVAPPRSGRPQHIPRPSGARVGAEAPWARLPPDARRFNLDILESRLSEMSPRLRADEPNERQRLSAVLIPLYDHEGETFVILTRRSAFVRAHRREVSFPGGAKESVDADLWSTALRETQEEIGLPPTDLRQIGRLDPRFTVSSNSLFHPFIAVLPRRPRGLRPDPAEVEEILHVSVAELLASGTFREELWPSSEGAPPRPISFFELDHDIIWGATATLLRRLLELGIPDMDSLEGSSPRGESRMSGGADERRGSPRRPAGRKASCDG